MRYFSKKRFTMRQVVGLLTFVFLGISVIVYAAVTVPNTFSSGTTISSSQVNANFTALGNSMPAVKTVNITSDFTVTATTAPYQNILSIDVTPPVNGYIILSGGGTLVIRQTTAGPDWVWVSLTTTSGGFNSTANETFHGISTPFAEAYSYDSFNVSGVFPVTGGATTTFYMTGRKFGTATTEVDRPRLTALFVPGTALP